MKTLYLVRHAKSDWGKEPLADIDRHLNNRGYGDAHKMSKLMKEKKLIPDLIITSPAIRAISTALIFCRNLQLNPAEIKIEPSLYETTTKQYLHVISQTDNQYKQIMIFGHNPTITNCANSLTNSFTEEMPTCAIVGITNKCSDWKSFINEAGEPMLYDFPKNHIG